MINKIISISLICLAISTLVFSSQKKSGDKFPKAIISNIDNASMVLVPEGEFIMGSSDEQVNEIAGPKDNLRHLMKTHEQPQHKVYLDAFYIDKYEVTNAQFETFVEKTGYLTDTENQDWGLH